MRLRGEVVDELELVTDANLRSLRRFQQAVVEAFATAEAVALLVVSHGGHHHELNLRGIYSFAARRLLDMERTEFKARLVIRENLEVHPIYTGEEETLAFPPLPEERVSVQLIGE